MTLVPSVLVAADWKEGLTVSTERVTVLLLSEPSTLALLAASVKVPLATEITPLVVLSAVGVKVAEYKVAEAEFQLERVPPETLTSD